jgi:hypothetical protein
MYKSIKELAWDVDEPTYRKDKAISYSTLSRFEREGWRKLSSLFDKLDTPQLTFGSAVDSILTDGEEDFNKRFIVCDFPPLSDSLIGVTKALHRDYGKTYKYINNIPDDAISNAAVACNYYAGNNYRETRIRKVKESCNEYYSLLTLAGDKTILSQFDYNGVMRCVEELRTNEGTKNFFSINPFEPHIEKVFQLKFRSHYNNIGVRCMFDLIIVDHERKIIYPVDLKTTGHPEEEFESSFASWRYDIQAKLYSYILQKVISQDDYFKDFKIASYQFVVINRYTAAPIVWEYKGNFGEVDLVDDNGKVYRDWRKIIIDLDYYLKHPEAKYKREVQENNGRMQINILKPVC